MTESKKVQSILEEIEHVNLDSLREAFINEEDPTKQELLNAIYTYALDEKQKEVINQSKFVI